MGGPRDENLAAVGDTGDTRCTVYVQSNVLFASKDGFTRVQPHPDVDRGARADAIEESWFEWQEGNRELCSECHGARLNRVARSARRWKLDITNPSRWWMND